MPVAVHLPSVSTATAVSWYHTHKNDHPILLIHHRTHAGLIRTQRTQRQWTVDLETRDFLRLETRDTKDYTVRQSVE